MQGLMNQGFPRQERGSQAARGVVNPFLRNAGDGRGNPNSNFPFGNPNLNVPQRNANLNFPNLNVFQGINNFGSFPFEFFENNQDFKIGTPSHNHSSGVAHTRGESWTGRGSIFASRKLSGNPD